MLPARPATLSARLAQLAVPPTDADLLARFLAARGESAFAELVRRHGPAVLTVCRRVTAHAHDAEDAFQATFLVLARKADRVRPGEPLGAWLYGVAVRAARKAVAWDRRPQEVVGLPVPDVPERPAEPLDPDVARAVVDEVDQLAPWYRAAVVLCELEGRSRAQAARELGIAEGTLSSRLATARKRLAAQLKARGYGPATLTALAGVAVPPDLSSAASAFATGVPAPAAVVALTHGVRRAMLIQRFRYAPLVLGVVASAALAAGLLAGPTPPPPAPARPAGPAADPPKAAPVPQAPAGLNRIVVWRKGELVGIDPDGKNETTLLTGPDGLYPYGFAVSPDGKRVAVFERTPAPTPDDARPSYRVSVRELGSDERRPLLGDMGEAGAGVLSWSGGGTELAAACMSVRVNEKQEQTHVSSDCFILNPVTKARTSLALPADHALTDWSPDGRYVLTLKYAVGANVGTAGLWLVNRGGTVNKPLTEDGARAMLSRFSRDGTRVLATLVRPTPETPEQKKDREAKGRLPTQGTELAVIDVASGRVAWVRGVRPGGAALLSSCWSPDGRRIAYTWAELDQTETNPTEREARYNLTVCDADGGNPRTILSATGRGREPSLVVLGGVDWR
jgi:RNA polymerase sigma factor (sigma-70 family)